MLMLDMAERMRQKTGINTVALSGGVFQNRHVLEKAEVCLREHQFEVFSPMQVPANDGGICLGQLAVAAAQ